MSSSVLDASALLALLLREPGGDFVAGVMQEGALIGAVNLSEVVSKLQELGSDEAQIRADIATAKFEVVEFDELLSWQAGLLRQSTRQFGPSLGDRACLALAGSLQLPALTGDRNWANVDVGVQVVLCR